MNGFSMDRVESEIPRLQLRGLCKWYGAVRAVRDAELTVQPGTVHALVGENGAGKSTVIKMIAGAVTPDSGTIEIDGAPVAIQDTQGAIGLGIATVYQEPQMFPELTVGENIFVGREIRSGGRIDWPKQKARVVEVLKRVGLPERLATIPAGDLTIAEQQQVAVAKAVSSEAQVMILDEPSAILSNAETEVLFDVVRRLIKSGVSVIYISHRLDELSEIADEITIMRDGSTVGTYPVANLTVREIAEKMVGGSLSEEERPHAAVDGAAILELEELSVSGQYDSVNLTVHSGEVVALYGLVGSGIAEVADTIYGMRTASSGRILVSGTPVRPSSPQDAQKLGIGLLPADRKGQGLFLFQPITFNISIGHLPMLSRWCGWFDRVKERKITRHLINRLNVRTPNERAAVNTLSGGNAQKVVLARQLVERPETLVLVEPTQGVDVGAKDEIHRIIWELADEGTAVLIVSSDLSEGLRIADRLAVMRSGEVVTEFSPDATQAEVLSAAAGAGQDDGGISE